PSRGPGHSGLSGVAEIHSPRSAARWASPNPEVTRCVGPWSSPCKLGPMTFAWSSSPTNRQQRRDRRISMSRLNLHITMSLEGYVAGPDQSTQHPLGIGGEQLHDWLVPLRAFRESHGEEGGEVNASTRFAEDILGGAGAAIMGRNMFGGGPGPRSTDSRKGWWGDGPHFHHPVFVLSARPREHV